MKTKNHIKIEPFSFPHNLELEQKIIKGCLLSGDEYNPVRAQILKELTPNDFYFKVNQEFFKSIANIDKKGIFPTLEAIWKDIKARRQQRCATQAQLNTIYQEAEIIIDENHSIKSLKDIAEKRNQIEFFNSAIKRCANGKCTAEEIWKYTADFLSNDGQRKKDDETYLDKLEMIPGGGLLKMDFPEIKWIVNDILTEGVTIFAGKPKKGKSVLMTNLLMAVATGGKFLNRDVVQGPALYLHLEDNQRRLQKRLLAMMPIDPYTGNKTADLSQLYCINSIAKVGEGGLRTLNEICKEYKPRLIVIDTWKPFAPMLTKSDNKKTLYDIDYEHLAKLRPLSEKYNCAIVVVMHIRKLEAADPVDLISGTYGKSGAVDNCLVMHGHENNNGIPLAKLATFGRDVNEELYTLEYTKYIWTWNLADGKNRGMTTETQQNVLDYILQNSTRENPVTTQQILDNTDITESNLKNKTIPKLLKDGLIIRPKRGYYQPAENDNFTTF